MSYDPLLRIKRDIDERLEVIETERSAVVPGAGLIPKRPRKRRDEEGAVLADILPDRRFDVATSQHIWGLLIGLEMRLDN